MVKAYVYELEKITGEFDKVKFIVNSSNDGEAKNEIQSHYFANRKKFVQYKGGKHNVHRSKITQINLTPNILEDENAIKINC